MVGRADNKIEHISLSADATRLAILDASGLTTVVDLAASQTLAQISIGSGTSLATMSPNGRFLAVTLDHYHPSVFDVDSKDIVASNGGHSGPITALSVSPDSEAIASASWDGTVHLWSPDSGSLLAAMIHDGQPTQLSFSPDGDHVVIGDAAGQITFYDSQSGTVRQTLSDHAGRITALSWSDDGQLLAAGDSDGHICLYAYNKLTAVRSFDFAGHRDAPLSFVFTRDSQRLLSCSGDSLRVWDTLSGVELLALTDVTELSSSIVSFSDSDELLAASGPYLRRWKPFPWDGVTSVEKPENAFQRDRRSRLEPAQTPMTLAENETAVAVITDVRMQKFLDELKRAVEENSDLISVSGDGLEILEAEHDFLFLLEPLDIIRSIADRTITDVSTAVQAIETAQAAVDSSPASLQVGIDRGMTQMRFFFYVEPVTSQNETISLKRPEAIAMYERLKDGIRQQLLDPPKQNVWLPGAILPMSVTKNDRKLYLKSRLAPDDVIVRINDEAITDLQSLVPVIDSLLRDLESGQRSSIQSEINRGEFHRARITYEITE